MISSHEEGAALVLTWTKKFRLGLCFNWKELLIGKKMNMFSGGKRPKKSFKMTKDHKKNKRGNVKEAYTKT